MNASAGDSMGLPSLMAKLSVWDRLNENAPLAEAPAHIQEAYERASALLSGLSEGDRDPWLGVKIYRVIRKSTRYIIYLDERLDVQWWWLTRPDAKLIGAIQARVNQLTHESAFLLEEKPDERKGVAAARAADGGRQYTQIAANIRSLIGEAMALALNSGSQEDCERVLAEAERYIALAKDQRCRPTFLRWLIGTVLVLGGIAVLWYWTQCLWCAAHEGLFVARWLEAGVAGAFGALVSAITRTSQLGLDPAAGRRGLRIEAVARALIGAGAGILVHFAFEGGVVLKGALEDGSNIEEAVRLFLCIAAGASERLLPSLVNRAETMVDGSPGSGSHTAQPADSANPADKPETSRANGPTDSPKAVG